MTTPAHDIGDLRILSVVFTDAATPPVETDPTTIVLTIKEPDGVIVTENFPGNIVDDPGDGKFHFDFAITKAGRHIVNWTGLGAVATASEDEFYGRRKEAVA